MTNIVYSTEPIKLSLFALLSELKGLLSSDNFEHLSQKLPTDLLPLISTLSSNDAALLDARKLALGNEPKLQSHSKLMAML